MSRSTTSETRQFQVSRYLFWVTFVLAAATSIALGTVGDSGLWPALLAVICMALYLVASRFWTPVVLKHEDYADSFYFLGFLLTLVALVATLMGLGEVADDEVQRLVLGRFGLALATTIFGLATRTALRMFQEKEEDSLLETSRQAQEALKQSAEELRVVLHNASTVLSTTLGAASSRIDLAVGDLTGRLATLRDGISDTGEHLGPWNDAIRDAETRTRTWSDGLAAAHSSTNVWAEQVENLSGDLARLDSAVEQSTRSLSGLSEAASTAADRARNMQAASAAISSSVDSLVEALRGLGRLPDVSAAVDNMIRAVGKGGEALDEFSRSASTAGTALERVRTESSAVTLDGLKELSALARKEAVALDLVVNQWRTALSQLATLTQQLGEQEAEASASLLAVQSELTAGVQFLTGLVNGDDK